MRLSEKEFYCIHRHNGLEHPKCYQRWLEEVGEEKVGFLDIEASNLKADFGIIFSWAIKKENGKIYGARLQGSDFRKNKADKLDREIVKELLICIKKFDRIVTYYGTKFDIAFIKSRAFDLNLDKYLPKYREVWHTDLYYVAKKNLLLSRTRLGNVGDLLKVNEKTPIDSELWRRALFGDDKALQYIFEHNKKDVITLEKVYQRMKLIFRLTRTSI